MHTNALVSLLAATAATANAAAAVPARYDGSCFYPQPDPGFNLTTYLGRWYQVAGTVAPYNRNCSCIYAQYALNDNGTVQVNNTCQAGSRPVNILGAAAPADAQYGADGVFRVQFPGERPPDCPGPNYIVQGM
jgi:apolipoprotein D and lipocalin family protein